MKITNLRYEWLKQNCNTKMLFILDEHVLDLNLWAIKSHNAIFRFLSDSRGKQHHYELSWKCERKYYGKLTTSLTQYTNVPGTLTEQRSSLTDRVTLCSSLWPNWSSLLLDTRASHHGSTTSIRSTSR